MMLKKLPVNKLPEKDKSVIVYDGVFQYAIFNVNGRFYATNHRCPHAGAPLSKGKIIEKDHKPKIRCPRHGWEFDLGDGSSIEHPVYCLATYDIVFADDGCHILVPERT